MVEKLSTEKHLAQFVRCSKKIAEQALHFKADKKYLPLSSLLIKDVALCKSVFGLDISVFMIKN
jgi:hypothetical protein